MYRVLKVAFEFDFAAIEIPKDERTEKHLAGSGSGQSLFFDHGEAEAVRRYVPITSENLDALDLDHLVKKAKAEEGVAFFLKGSPTELSSGQRLFAYIVINILGAIRRNSLLLIDEPELFLHPTLEIQFVDMLKSILIAFNSKALLATHSVVTVREVPSDCVHGFERTKDGLVVKHPPFQTFGGDFQRISSYVFGDRAISKPFEAWIARQIREQGSAEAVLESLGGELSEELIVQIRAMGKSEW